MKPMSKTAVVVNGCRGVGLASAKALVESGLNVVVSDAEASIAKAALDRIDCANGQVQTYVGPVDSIDSAQRLMCQAATAFGRVDVVVLNSGHVSTRSITGLNSFDLDSIDTCLRSVIATAQAAAQQMTRQADGGRLLLVAPEASVRPVGMMGSVFITAGIRALARTLASELADSGITVNAVIPASRAADPTQAYLAAYSDVREDDSLAALPEPRSTGPRGVAALVAFLCLETRGITGCSLGVGADTLSCWEDPHAATVVYNPEGWNADQIAEMWGTIAERCYEEGRRRWAPAQARVVKSN